MVKAVFMASDTEMQHSSAIRGGGGINEWWNKEEEVDAMLNNIKAGAQVWSSLKQIR